MACDAQSLPKDALLCILSKLSPDELLLARAVCPHWRNVLRESGPWQEFVITRVPRERRTVKLIQAFSDAAALCGGIRKLSITDALHLRNADKAAFVAILSANKDTLKSVVLTGARWKSDDGVYIRPLSGQYAVELASAAPLATVRLEIDKSGAGALDAETHRRILLEPALWTYYRTPGYTLLHTHRFWTQSSLWM